MKKTVIALLLGALVLTACNQEKESSEGEKTELSNDVDSISYALGIVSAINNENREWENLNPDAFAAAMRDYYADKENTVVSEKEAMGVLDRYHKNISVKPQQEFLDSTKNEEGVVTTETGLQYRVVKKGEGPIPSLSDSVVCHYRGKLIDGTVFDESYRRGAPLEIGANQVVKGWQEALTMMPVGSKWELFIPYNLGYGAQGGGPIPAYATLIFEMELLGIKEK